MNGKEFYDALDYIVMAEHIIDTLFDAISKRKVHKVLREIEHGKFIVITDENKQLDYDTITRDTILQPVNLEIDK